MSSIRVRKRCDDHSVGNRDKDSIHAVLKQQLASIDRENFRLHYISLRKNPKNGAGISSVISMEL